MKFFTFKQFRITDDCSAMKVGTDSVILASWIGIKNVKTVLDMGCGSGLISVMLAQRTDVAEIQGVEIDAESCKDCQINFENAPWSNRLKLYQGDIRCFMSDEKFDLIISNPPFFTESLLPSKEARATARHDHNLGLNELIKSASTLLDREGVFAIVFPYLREEELIARAREYDLFPHRIMRTKNKPNAVLKRTFIEFRKFEGEKIEFSQMEIRNEQNIYSDAYKNLTKDFYLNF